MTLPPWAANGLPPPLPIICPANGEDCAEPGCPGGAKCVRKPPTREARLEDCLNFFASVIKSGEAWSDTCEAHFRAAKAK